MKQWRCTVCGQVFEGDKPPVPCPVCGAGESAFEELPAVKEAVQNSTGDRFVLVGGGIAALEAARAIRKRNRDAAITMVTAEPQYPYHRPALTRAMADELVLAKVLIEKPVYYSEHNITVLTGTVAEGIDIANRRLRLANGQQLPYSRLLLATGAVPNNPIPREPGAVAVHTLRTYADAETLMGAAAGKRVVLVGGGILGLEAAMALRAQGATVTIVEIAPRILPLQADEAVSAMLAARLKELGFGLVLGTSVAAADKNGVVLGDGAAIACDLVLASMGVRSDVALAAGAGLAIGRGIVVDAHMHTSAPAIWAAGDCAEYDGKVRAMVGAAAGMGAVAGASMAGDESTPYTPFTPATAFSCPGFSLFSVGHVAHEGGESVQYRNEADGSYRRLFFAEGKLVGALFVGKHPGAKAVAAVAAGATLQEALPLLL